MAKNTPSFSCQDCSATYRKWQGRCDSCGEWNTIAEAAPAPRGVSSGAAPVSLKKVEPDRAPRFGSGIEEFDRTVGGGLVPGSLVLLGGDPGIGKSTLVLQLARAIAARKRVLYVSGEESAEQVKLRADRLGELPENLEILVETDLERISALAPSYDLLIVDSIQVMTSPELPAAAGSVSQVATGAAKLQSTAKRGGPATLIIGHVTKEGGLAGPKTLEHLVDVVLYLEGERSGELRLLRSVKNRFGRTGEVGIFEMTSDGLIGLADPSQILINTALGGQPGTVPTITLEGVRPLAVEIQALSSLTSFGYPRRTASGIDLDRLQLTVAVLSKRAGLPLQSQDVYVNVVGGIRLSDPAIGLPLALAIASSLKSVPVSPGVMAFGEVGLSGEIRPVAALERRIEEARRLGYKKFLTPRGGKGAGVVAVTDLSQALRESGVLKGREASVVGRA